MKTAYLVSGIRTPFAKAGTDLKAIHAAEMGRFALSELFARSNLSLDQISKAVDEVVIGNTGTPADAANISRVVALKAGLPRSISAYTVHRNCASGLESIAQAALKVAAGAADVMVAGGTESMSQMPLMYNQRAVDFFDKLSRAKSLQERLTVLAQTPVADFLKPRIAIVEGLTDPFCSLNMGQTAEVLAKEFSVTREEQDQFALESHQRAVAATEAGRFKEEIAPYPLPPKFEKVLEADSGPRKNQTLEALKKLKPFFDKKFGSVTVGNSCPITDGAAMVFVTNDEGLKKLGNPKPLAKIRAWAFAGLDPQRMGLGPVYSSHLALKKAGLSLKDIQVVELNEAFAAQALACLKAFESKDFCQRELGLSEAMGSVSRAILNPNGGAIALGHPVGTSGTRIALTAALEMKRKGYQFGLATLCIGGGQGGAIVLEAV